MAYAVQGAFAPSGIEAFRPGHFRRLAVLLIALALAITLIALEAPAPTEASAGYHTEAQRVVAYARSHIGAKFRLGTTGMRYFDCSGLVFRVYAQAGLLNRIGGTRKRAAGYYSWFHKRGLASRSNPKVGDIIIWTHNGRISHTGLYVGSGYTISALINPYGVKKTHINTIHARFFAFLHVRLQQ